MPETYHYPGQELELFQKATNWKSYLAREISPYLQGAVLEVGAGIGATARLLNEGKADRWVMLEPDATLFGKLEQQEDGFPPNTLLRQGTLNAVSGESFNTILYIDVLEHIEDDRGELSQVAAFLRPGGRLIVLSPAYHFLYSEFDRAIGHYRRYTKKTIKALTPPGLRLDRMRYLDAAGFFASTANKCLLHQSYPTEKQVLFWDRYLVPFSRLADPVVCNSFGKSILAIWEKTAGI